MFIALILSLSLLAGCGNSSALKRRRLAMDVFDISAREYRRNWEYYDMLLKTDGSYDTYFQEESEKERIKAEKTADAEIKDAFDLLNLYDPVNNGEDRLMLERHNTFSLDTIMEHLSRHIGSFSETSRYHLISAIKKEDLYYTDEVNANLALYSGFSYISPGSAQNAKAMIGGEEKTFMWPELSLSAGDALVACYCEREYADSFSTDLFRVSNLRTCLPCYLYESDSAPEGTLQITFTNQDVRLHYVSAINGDPVLKSPLLEKITDDEEEAIYIVRGEPNETVVLEGELFFDEIDNSGVVETKFKGTSYVFDVDEVYEYKIGDRPEVDGSYSILMDQNTDPVPPGLYMFHGFPLRIIR